MNPPDEPIVEFIGARKRYGETEALKGIDLRVCAGEVMALLGPSESTAAPAANCRELKNRRALSPLRYAARKFSSV